MPFLLYVLAVAVFAQGTSEFMLSGLLPGIAADLGVPVATTGRLSSAFAAGIVLGAPAMALLARRWPPRVALAGFLAVFAGAHVAGALAPTLDALLVFRVLAALANAGFIAVALATVAAVAPEDRRGRALAVVLGGTTLALVAGVPAGALVGTALGWRATLWCVAAVTAACVVAVAALAPTRAPDAARGDAADVSRGDVAHAARGSATPAAREGAADGGAADVSRGDRAHAARGGAAHGGAARSDVSGGAADTAGGGVRAELAALRRPRAVADAALAVLVNGATFCTYTFLAPVVTGTGLGEAAVPVALVLWGVGAFAGVTVAGRVADARWRTALALGGPILVLGWLALLGLADVAFAVLVLSAVVGALSFGVGSVLIARIMAEAHGAAALAGAFATVALNVGAVIGPVAGGAALDGIGTRGPIVISTALAALALVLGATLAWRQSSGSSRSPSRN